ncbi:hypothetical protein AQPE_4874 [Aquipluma nitroreducens]|uniref:Uncharacterized protein n=1 Tax=Aquipluma nitroreducens TaxID=2010828 RepID=A0A5K7SGE6_9BACT|nr:hypothetical protein AQPE_4874 [Aquipluma nitroreducens]
MSTAQKVNNISFVVSQIVCRICHSSTNNITGNVGSYTQGRIAGDFLSSRKAARAERYTPKTTAAALDG